MPVFEHDAAAAAVAAAPRSRAASGGRNGFRSGRRPARTAHSTRPRGHRRRRPRPWARAAPRSARGCAACASGSGARPWAGGPDTRRRRRSRWARRPAPGRPAPRSPAPCRPGRPGRPAHCRSRTAAASAAADPEDGQGVLPARPLAQRPRQRIGIGGGRQQGVLADRGADEGGAQREPARPPAVARQAADTRLEVVVGRRQQIERRGEAGSGRPR